MNHPAVDPVSRDRAGDVVDERQLRGQPWLPLQPGDVVLCHRPPVDDTPAFGQTFVAGTDGGRDRAGSAMLREVSRSAQPWSDGDEVEPDYLLRFDTRLGRWRIDCQDVNGFDDPQPWMTVPGLGPDDLDLAKAGVVDNFANPDLPGYDEIIGWCEHPRGWVPVFNAGNAPTDPDRLTSFADLWFVAGPAAVTVIRAGAVVYGRPARAVVSA